MKLMHRITVVILGLVFAVLGTFSQARAGALVEEFYFETLDYNDCTAEVVMWYADVHSTSLGHETPIGQGMFRDNWVFKAVLEGLDSGYMWTTKGTSHYIETYSLDNNLTGGWMLVENAILKPATPGAPRVRLDAKIHFAYNADGDLVVERDNYTYHCMGN
jgi:hypothetical protein